MFTLLTLLACGKTDTNLTALVPEIAVNYDVLDFGEVVANRDTETLELTVSNEDRGLLHLDSVALSSDSSAAFEVEPLSEMEISGTGELTVRVSYTPTDTGQDLGQLIITSNDEERPEVALQVVGYGVEPDLDISPQTLWFTDVEAGSSEAQSVSIQARGYGALEIYSLELADEALAEVFSLNPLDNLEDVSDEAPGVYNSGDTTGFTVTFSPTDATAWEGSVLLRTNAPGAEVVQIGLFGNSTYDGETPPEVEIIAPTWGNYLTDAEEVTLQGRVVDDFDPPESMGAYWYAVVDGAEQFLSGTGLDADGYTTTSATLPVGQPVILKLKATDLDNNTGEDQIEVDVWAAAEPSPYTISGGGLFDYWSVDDDITIYLDGTPIFSDTDHRGTTHAPFEFEAVPGQILRIVANDVNASEKYIDALTLHWGTSHSQALNEEQCVSSNPDHGCYDPAYYGPWPNVFLDESYTISIP